MYRLYTLVFLSGVAGLFYEMAWHKYLVIMFGSQAKATAMVLAIFLGGIALGYALFGAWTKKFKGNHFYLYAGIELAMGLWAFSFNVLFNLALRIVPIKASLPPWVEILVDFTLACLLIGPPTILMGGTLPVLTQAVRVRMDRVTTVHALIYGINTLGAAFGSLFAGYYLLVTYDLKTVVMTAGTLNLLVGALSLLLYCFQADRVQTDAEDSQSIRTDSTLSALQFKTIIAVAGVSGFVTLTLQSLMVRLMGLSMGSSEFSFCLTVSIFILGLGLGSILVSRVGNWSMKHLAAVQTTMALGLTALYFTIDRWPYWVHLLRTFVRDTSPAFYVYQIEVALFFFAVLIVPIGLAGMILPLCFHLIKDSAENHGFRVGQIYSINTLGSVAGAMVGGFFLLNWLNMDSVFRLCVILVTLSSAVVYILSSPLDVSRLLSKNVAAVGALVASAALIMTPDFDKRPFIQAFRSTQQLTTELYDYPGFLKGINASSFKEMFYKDGPTSTISMTWPENEADGVALFVNGKCDANTNGDYLTMAGLAHLAANLVPSAERTFIVGFGSGITAGVLAQYPDTKRIDVAELSETLIENAPKLDPYNHSASTNPKISIHSVDAFNFLMRPGDDYDAIISEPSNPWVVGVENLFSTEFYTRAKQRLSPKGVFVQWIHGYSFTDELFAMVVKTISSEFPEVRIFQLGQYDYALVVSKSPIERSTLLNAQHKLESTPSLQPIFKAAGFSTTYSLLAMELLPDASSLLANYEGPTNSIYNPKLSHLAARAFFEGSSTDPAQTRRQFGKFYESSAHSLLSRLIATKPSSERAVLDAVSVDLCLENSQFSESWPFLCDELRFYSYHNGLVPREQAMEVVVAAVDEIKTNLRSLIVKESWEDADFETLTSALGWYKTLYSPIARFDTEDLTKTVHQCLSALPQSSELYSDCVAANEFVKLSFERESVISRTHRKESENGQQSQVTF